MIKKIMDKIKKEGKFSFEKIVEENVLSDNEFFELLKFLHIENIPEVRTSLDGKDFIVLENENFYMEEREIIKTYLEDIKNKYEDIENEENLELIDKYLKIGVKESLIYSKYGFSFLDLTQEATLGLINAINYYDEIKTLAIDPEFFLKSFAIKYILEFQKNLLKDIRSSELSYILYLKTKVDKEMGRTVEEISKQMNVSVDYIEQLEKLFDEIEPEENLVNIEILEKADKVTQMYILENIPKKLSYIDERILIMAYGLEDKVYNEKEISKELNIALHNVNILKEKALNKLSIDLLKNEFTENVEDMEYAIN